MKRVSPAPYTADLHAHSTCSDGALSPTALVSLARRRGVRHLALTDHDTMAGFAEAQAAGNKLGVQIIPAVELSVRHTPREPGGDPRELHLLGYFIDPHHRALSECMCDRRSDRERRVRAICARLAELGVPVEVQAVLASAPGNVGRPHVARALLNAGHVKTIDEAFTRFLGDGRPAYVANDGPSVEEGIALIHAAGGVTALAHPGIEGADADLPGLTSAGLDGLECAHPSHSGEATRRYRALAGSLGLVATGGSDFHRAEGGAAPGRHGVEPLIIARLHERRRLL
jgi:predicted metal-dependent phosphoesterase TrpH